MDIRQWIKNNVTSLLMLPLMIYWAVSRGEYTLLDNADLVIHEAGHAFFFFFGRFIHSLGGTLMQILLPLLIAHYFFRNFYRTGLQIALLWLGQNFINISVYAADASARKLRLLGGNKAGHDWHYMLSELGLLKYDSEIGYLFFSIALLIFLLSLIIPTLFPNS